MTHNILVFTWEYPPVMVGGLGRHVYELSLHLSQLGHNIIVVTRQEQGRDTAIENLSGFSVLRVREDPLNIDFFDDLVGWTFALGSTMVRATFAYLRELGSWKPDIIHAHDWIVSQPAITISEYYDAPLVTTIHATEAGRHMGWVNTYPSKHIHSIEWWLAAQSDAIIVCSEFMLTEIHQALKIPREKIHIIPNGINISQWHNTPSTHKQPTGNIFFMGRLEYEKGVQDLISAMPLILPKFPQATLSIAGSGTQTATLKQLVQSHNLNEAIEFCGPLSHDELIHKIDYSDVVVLPSRYEPFGIVALEVAMRATPVVVTDRSGLAELIRIISAPQQIDCEDLICEPANEQSIAEATCAILGDYSRAVDRAEKLTASLVGMDFSWDKIAKETTRVYDSTSHHQPALLPKPNWPQRVLTNRP